MFRGLRRLFRFRLRMVKLHEATPYGNVVADWEIIDRRLGVVVLTIEKNFQFNAQTALRWYRKYCD